MDCDGCEKRVRDSVTGMKAEEEQAHGDGLRRPVKVLKRVCRKSKKKAELWPFIPYTMVDHPYAPGVYDRKAPAGYVRNAAAVNPQISELARAGSEEQRYISAFSDENPMPAPSCERRIAEFHVE
ncbi:unnamed protein product [Spirodela intermedia]|uniref:Uncharacterized protein n=1 Tax=Spirodela intermedia TaxID=51605 RepID=A0A7I8IDY5_SPIIN|nr:unnamed protein product [Spirodela intermedia]CAA6655998.1 unnamed protein product [Spirodela intermedia]